MKGTDASKRMAFLVAMIAMVLAVRTLSRFEQTSYEHCTSDELWAIAVLHSIIARDAEPKKVIALYQQAIDRSSSPAELYVSLGDYLRSPAQYAVAFSKLAADEKELERAAGKPELLDQHLDNLVAMLQGSEPAVAAYAAAVKAAPETPLPHFRMAIYGEGEAALRSARWLSENQPFNSLSPLLEAALVVESNPDLVLPLVVEANRREMLQLYNAPVPPCGKLRYPSFYGEYAGRPVTQSALGAIINYQNTWAGFSNSPRKPLESVLDHLQTIAENDQDPDSAVALSCHHTCCHQLVFNVSGDVDVFFAGFFRARRVYPLARKRFVAGTSEYERIVREHEQIDRVMHLFQTEWMPQQSAIRDINPAKLYLNGLDPLAEGIRLMKQIQSSALEEAEP